jgi:dinuclear metal center YbgI/SA1388 family protein
MFHLLSTVGVVMVELNSLERYCNELLITSSMDDYCPNGVQVDIGSREVRRLVSAVTACQAAIDEAVEMDADLLLVHHGLFWRGDPAPLTGLKGLRVGALYRGDLNLMAYHLPLDAHPELGNNRLLGEQLGLPDGTAVADESGLLWQAELPVPESAAEFAQRIQRALDRQPLHLPGGAEQIRRVAWCTGAAQDHIAQAVTLGVDAFISGEVSEQTTHLASELGIHYFAAGHHATERFGVQALGRHLADQFDLEHHFLDISNPV